MLSEVSNYFHRPKPEVGDIIQEAGGQATFVVEEVGMKYVVARNSDGDRTMVKIQDVVIKQRGNNNA